MLKVPKIIYLVPFFLLILISFPSSVNATFVKSPLNPLLNVGLPGSWDSTLVSSPATIIDIDGFKTWYY